MNQFPLKNLVLKDRGCFFFFFPVMCCCVGFVFVWGFFVLLVLVFLNYTEKQLLWYGVFQVFWVFFPNMHAIEEALGYS